MKNKWKLVSFLSLITIILLVLGACTNNGEDTKSNSQNESQNTEDNMEEMDHSHMDMKGSADVPKDLKEEENPTYKVGSKVMIEEGHMEGMKGAEATVVGAYHTIAYTISYTPADGGEKVKNHKWVIHEELVKPGDAPLKPGTEVIVNAEHMTGMGGVKATIDSAEETTVYMIDFIPTTGGDKVTNHKWVTESELSPVK